MAKGKKKPAARKKATKKKRIIRWVANILAVLLLLIGLALIFNDYIKDWLIQQNTDKYALETVTREDILRNQNADATFDFDEVIPISSEAVIRAQFENNEFATLGAIAIPSVNINLPIFKGTNYAALFYGAGTLKEDQVMGERNYALASHKAVNNSLLFGPLENAQLGDLIYLTDLDRVFTYEIFYSEIVSPYSGYLIDDVPDETLVTLVTCNASGSMRLVVQGRFVEAVSVDDASQAMNDAFSVSLNTY
ncbi:class A sortase [Enterococcus sp. HY326]|uniref:class A sortase n=1 Tax=Enterococcus sp. HY326 TaxID=2971265 RepID=UPI0022409534|nr:class A sortase [Enterococcus sp. HY326]